MMQKQGEEKKNANKVTGTQPLQAQSPDVRERPTAGNKEEKVPQVHQDRPYSKRVIQKDQNAAPQGQQYRLYSMRVTQKG